MHPVFKLLTLVLPLLIVGCSEKQPAPKQQESEDQLISLNAKMDAANQAIAELQNAVKNNPSASTEKLALLTVDNKAPVALKTDFGPLLFKINKVYSAGNNTKLQLAIGNPYAVSFNEASFTITYGRLDENGNLIEASQKSREVSLSKTIAPANTTVMTLDIKDMGQQDLHYLIVDNLKFKSIGMR